VLAAVEAERIYSARLQIVAESDISTGSIGEVFDPCARPPIEIAPFDRDLSKLDGVDWNHRIVVGAVK
jgi:hypothetical protein